MTTDLPHNHALIVEQLLGDLQPVRVWREPILLFVFLGTALLLAFVGVALTGVRGDLGQKRGDIGFFITTALILVLMVGGYRTGLRLAIPGEPPHLIWLKVLFWLPFGLMGVALLGWIDEASWANAAKAFRSGWGCTLNTLLVGSVPVAVGLSFLSRLMVFRPRATTLFATLAGLSAGALAMQFHCPSEQGLHLTLWHYAPLWLGSLLAARYFSPWIVRRRLRA